MATEESESKRELPIGSVRAGVAASDHPFEMTLEQKRAFVQYVGGHDGYRMWFQDWVLEPVRGAVESYLPSGLSRLYEEIRVVEDWCSNQQEEPYLVPPGHLPVMRRAALHYRHQVALRQERVRAVSTDATHHQEIDAQTDEIDAILNLPGFKEVRPIRRPRLTDYVNLKTARALLVTAGHLKAVERSYDEKFGILWGPQQFRPVIEAARIDAWLLGSSVGVAYLDIDDFKAVNTNHSETTVDREVLPPFMLLLEAHTSSRGYAFRFGGDEYVVLFPNVDGPLVKDLVERIRADVEKTQFGPQKITVSIGYVVVEDDSPLTDDEVLRLANRAKNDAKTLGKNRVIEAEP